MGDGGGHSYGGVAALLETTRMTQALRLPRFPFTRGLFTEARGLLPPLARGGLGLETPRVIAAAVELVGGFAVLAVPRKAALHQAALLCVGAELRRRGRGREEGGEAQGGQPSPLFHLSFIPVGSGGRRSDLPRAD